MPVTQARLPGFQSAKSARWYQALIGPIQATGSAGGFDLLLLRLLEMGSNLESIPFQSGISFFDRKIKKIEKRGLTHYPKCYIINPVPRGTLSDWVWRSLVACLNGVQEAGSSNLLTQTKEAMINRFFFAFF